ncbi:hypothetical protein NEUTE1DRAFT_107904 [Neurospora tetrasperma FGSC 2508]|uniref:Uncharacterized protein n=1 Tax=Neurospora tetrasperma (strain FGSC 2508 / ATCC MYA-4615 / P0657) TaxID=510951 RepID=F8MD73_NEUT8|nr:uncharacterized protein NEUTE1DRAFT_107904 [Neurospora tetrasperma FGSC 2508]EGO61418.1 hypothetical protein NEUTE1DRAFT_107904 [Neurospora tetrasperma FGSC 2508]EGZ74554.1 hypothetical protein NEUTE2DRAFT_54991 [Neurospora tetrasperma FGSC 2509]
MDQAQVSVPQLNLRIVPRLRAGMAVSACLHAHISDGQPSAGSAHPNTCPLPRVFLAGSLAGGAPPISDDLHGHCYLARLYVSNLLHALLCAPSPHFPMRSYTHSYLAICWLNAGKLARTRECGSQVTFVRPPARLRCDLNFFCPTPLLGTPLLVHTGERSRWENRGVVGNWI